MSRQVKVNGSWETIAGADTRNFVGTTAEWRALTTAQKAKYDTVDLTDDCTCYAIVDPEPTTGSGNAVASGGVAEHLIAGNKKFYFDYQDGKYGYNTSANRGADTFVPFSSSCQYVIQLNATTASLTLDHNTGLIVLCLGVQQNYIDRFTVKVNDTTYTMTSLGNIGTGSNGWGLSAFYTTGDFRKGQTVSVTGRVSGYGAILIC